MTVDIAQVAANVLEYVPNSSRPSTDSLGTSSCSFILGGRHLLNYRIWTEICLFALESKDSEPDSRCGIFVETLYP